MQHLDQGGCLLDPDDCTPVRTGAPSSVRSVGEQSDNRISQISQISSVSLFSSVSSVSHAVPVSSCSTAQSAQSESSQTVRSVRSVRSAQLACTAPVVRSASQLDLCTVFEHGRVSSRLWNRSNRVSVNLKLVQSAQSENSRPVS
jgi:hypothetical protein